MSKSKLILGKTAVFSRRKNLVGFTRQSLLRKFSRVKSVRSYDMFYTYILESLKDKNLYVGYTDDLRRRFGEHNLGKVEITKRRRPFRLIYYEAFLHQQDATSREKYFKTGWGRTFLKKVLKNYYNKYDTSL